MSCSCLEATSRCNSSSALHAGPDGDTAQRKCDEEDLAANAVDETLEIEVFQMSGNSIFQGRISTCSTVEELLALMPLYRDNVKHVLTHEDHGILGLREQLGNWLKLPRVRLTLITRPLFHLCAKDIGGAHTSNSEYFTRESQGTEEEYLRLKKVCWFQVGGTFPDVPPGNYNVVIEAKRHKRLDLCRNQFAVTVAGQDFGHWDAASVLQDQFQEFEVAQFEQTTAGPVHVELNMRASWCSGFCWKAIFLK